MTKAAVPTYVYINIKLRVKKENSKVKRKNEEYKEAHKWILFLRVPWGAFSRPIQALFIFLKRTQKRKGWESMRLVMNLKKRKRWKRRDLERDEIDEEFCIGVKGFGIGGDVAPKFSECRRCLRMTRAESSRSKRVVDWSSEAPILPFNREHYQSRSHHKIWTLPLLCPLAP